MTRPRAVLVRALLSGRYFKRFYQEVLPRDMGRYLLQRTGCAYTRVRVICVYVWRASIFGHKTEVMTRRQPTLDLRSDFFFFFFWL